MAIGGESRAGGKPWFSSVDYLRGFAITGIVAIHVFAYGLNLDPSDPVARGALIVTHFSGFAVSLFFAISGFVLAARYYERFNVLGFYKRRMLVILLPFMAFSVVYVIFNWFVLGQKSVEVQIVSFLVFNATGPFWFVAVIVQLYLLYPLVVRMYRWFEGRRQEWVLLLACVLLDLAWSAFLKRPWESLFGEDALPGGNNLPPLFLGYLVFFVGGIYVLRNREKLRVWYHRLSRVWCVALPVLFLAAIELTERGLAWAVIDIPNVIVMACLLLRVSECLERRQGLASRTVKTFGMYSYGIFLAHMGAISVVAFVLHKVDVWESTVLFYILMMVGVMALSTLVIYVLGRLPYGKYIAGIKTGPAKVEKGRITSG